MQQNDYLQVGVITSTHGIKGEVKVFPTTDDPNRFRALKDVVLDTGKEQIPLEIEGVKFFKQYVILKFKGIDNINDIEKYKGRDLWIPREEAQELDEDEYYYYTPDNSLEQIADSLKHMYDFVKKDEYSTYYEVYQAHQDWCDPILTEAEELVQAYVGVDSEVIESGQIREMSRTKLVVLLERSYNKDES